jgi:hypothetical protein
MRRSTTNHLLSLGLLSLGTLALAPGCADNNSSLFLVGVIDIDAAACLAKPDTTGSLLASGTLDLSFTSSYTATLLVGNQLTQRGSREQLRTETSRITLRGAEVTLTTLDNGQTLGGRSFSTVGTGFVDAAAGDIPSYGVMSVNLIPTPLGLSIAVEKPPVVLAKIRVFGDTLGGTAITSGELDFPIRVCRGCLVSYPASAAETAGATAPYLCSRATTAAAATAAAPCVTGQDRPFSCTLCSSASDVCRDPKNNCFYNVTTANCTAPP